SPGRPCEGRYKAAPSATSSKVTSRHTGGPVMRAASLEPTVESPRVRLSEKAGRLVGDGADRAGWGGGCACGVERGLRIAGGSGCRAVRERRHRLAARAAARGPRGRGPPRGAARTRGRRLVGGAAVEDGRGAFRLRGAARIRLARAGRGRARPDGDPVELAARAGRPRRPRPAVAVRA